jgi:hypothetical protein
MSLSEQAVSFMAARGRGKRDRKRWTGPRTHRRCSATGCCGWCPAKRRRSQTSWPAPGDMAGGLAAFQDAIATGHPTWAPEAMMGVGHWLDFRGDRDGALAAYQQAIDSGRAELTGRAQFSAGQAVPAAVITGRAGPAVA